MFCIEKALNFMSDKDMLEEIARAVEEGVLKINGVEI